MHSRTFIDAGVGAIHLFKPSTSFAGSSIADLPQRITYSAVGQIQLMDMLDVQLNALHQTQGEYYETIFGALGKIYISQKKEMRSSCMLVWDIVLRVLISRLLPYNTIIYMVHSAMMWIIRTLIR